jgi:hypothetical protein
MKIAQSLNNLKDNFFQVLFCL